MGQTTDQIETDIKQSRQDLRSNLEELENKVKSVTDWRQQFQNHPATMVAAAFGAGALLAALGGRRSSGRRPPANFQPETARAAGIVSSRPGQKHEVLETWDNVKSALVGVAATQVTGFLGRLVPGFQEQLQKLESSAGRSSRAEKDPAIQSH